MTEKWAKEKPQYQERKRKRVEKGLCGYCGKNVATEGYVSCAACRETKNEQRKKNDKRLKGERKSAGLCTHCGKRNAVDGENLCSKCKITERERRNKDRDFFEQRGICTRCRTNKALPNRKCCAECSYERRFERAKYPKTEEQRIKERTIKREKRKDRKDRGDCTRCGKRKADKGYATCSFCRFLITDAARNARRKKDVTQRDIFYDGHHCVICGSENTYKEYRMCEEHYYKSVKSLMKARSEQKKRIESGNGSSTFYEGIQRCFLK